MTIRLISGLTGVIATVEIAVSDMGTFIHESAHGQADHLFYRVVESEIKINSFIETLFSNNKLFGYYNSRTNGLSEIGELLGEDVSDALVSAAGPAADTSVSLGLFIVGDYIKKYHPNTSIALKSAGLTYFTAPLNHFYQLLTSNNGDLHNFSERLQISPIFTALLLLFTLPAAYLMTKIKE